MRTLHFRWLIGLTHSTCLYKYMETSIIKIYAIMYNKIIILNIAHSLRFSSLTTGGQHRAWPLSPVLLWKYSTEENKYAFRNIMNKYYYSGQSTQC